MATKLIFVYGSNMNQQDLQRYCQEKNLPNFNWKKIANACLEGFTLAWNVYSKRRKGGVLNLKEQEEKCIWGIILEVSESDLQTLDKKEGHPNHYKRTNIQVKSENGTLYDVATYIAPADTRCLYFLPTPEYLEIVLQGAISNRLPQEYVDDLENTPTYSENHTLKKSQIAIYAGVGVTLKTLRYWLTLFNRYFDVPLKILYSYQFSEVPLQEYQLIILPGGKGTKICQGLQEAGKTNLRNYVNEGGKILGVCAGAYALTHQKPEYLHLSPLKIKDFAHTKRGEAIIPVEFNSVGKKFFEADDEIDTVIFHNGPIVYEESLENASNLQYLGYFRDEITHPEGEKGLMKDSPFGWINQYAKGWVLGVSPHFERTAGKEYLIRNLIKNFMNVHLILNEA